MKLSPPSKHFLLYFKTTVSILCLNFFSISSYNSVSIPVMYIDQALLVDSFFKIAIFFLAVLKAKCARYLHSLLIYLRISLFPVICFELLITRTPDNSNVFRLP